MSEKITVPALGESVSEATVSKWLKLQGEKVSADEPIVELETDKVNVEVPSPINGVLGSIAVGEGETVNVGSLLGTVDKSASNEETTKEANNYNPPKKVNDEVNPKIFVEEKKLKPKNTKTKKIKEPELKLEDEEPLILENIHEEKPIQKKEKQISPAARKMANSRGVDMEHASGWTQPVRF